MQRILTVLTLISIATIVAFGHTYRSRAVTRDFQLAHPCPSTGLPYGRCPGYIKDHIQPLCLGGPDAVSNMQWQTVEEAKAKDRWECLPLKFRKSVD